MPRFRYKAKAGLKEVRQGIIEAPNREGAYSGLTQQGLHPLSLEPILDKPKKGISLLRRPISQKRRDLFLFTWNLANLLPAGIPLLQGIELASTQLKNRALQQVTSEVADRIRAGASFSEALGLFPGDFPAHFVSLIQAGERGGSLGQVLREAADGMEKEDELRSRVAQAVLYPALIFGLGFVTVGLILTNVIPRIEALYEDIGGTLPILTRGILRLSRLVRGGGWILFLAILGVGLIFFRKKGQVSVRGGKFLLRLPVVGDFLRDSDLVRFSRTLGMLVRNGVPLSEGLSVTAGVLLLNPLRETVISIREKVLGGKKISQAIGEDSLIPSVVQNLIGVAEESGTLEETLSKIASLYEKMLDRQMKVFTSVLEPALVLLVGGFVGLIVIGMLLPTFQISVFVR